MNNRNDIRRIKYHFVLNITGDPTIARRARMWSLDRISDVFGVSTTKTYYGKTVNILERPPRVEKLTERQRQNRKRRFKSRDITIPVIPKPHTPTARKPRSAPVYDSEYADHIPEYDIPQPQVSGRRFPRIPSIKSTGTTRISNIDELWADIRGSNKFPNSVIGRESNWAFWAQDGNEYPDYINDTVRRINKDANKRPEDSYGFAVVYYMYVNELQYNDLRKSIRPHKYVDDFYEDNLKHLGV